MSAAPDPAIAEAAALLETRPTVTRGPATEAEIAAYLARGGTIVRLPMATSVTPLAGGNRETNARHFHRVQRERAHRASVQPGTK